MNLKVLSIVMGLLLSLCGYRATAKSSEQNVEWKAKMDQFGDYPEQPNTWLNFRKEVNLPNVPTSVIARIGADSKYWLWINGKPVVFEGGLKRGPNPLDTYYDEGGDCSLPKTRREYDRRVAVVLRPAVVFA